MMDMTSPAPQGTTPVWILRPITPTHSYRAWLDDRQTGYFNMSAAGDQPQRLAEPESMAGIRAGWAVPLPLVGFLAFSPIAWDEVNWDFTRIIFMIILGLFAIVCLISDIVFSRQMRTQFRAEQTWFEANKGHIAPVSDRKYDLPRGWYDLARETEKRCTRATEVPEIGPKVREAQATLAEWLDTPQPTDFGQAASISTTRNPAVLEVALEYRIAIARNDRFKSRVEMFLTEIDETLLIHQAQQLHDSK